PPRRPRRGPRRLGGDSTDAQPHPRDDRLGRITFARTVGEPSAAYNPMMWAHVLAQSGQSEAVGQIVLWVGVMVGALVVLAVVLRAPRRRLLAPAREPEAGMFDHLRRRRQEGSTSPQEYDTIRQRIDLRLAGNESPPRNESQPGDESPLADESPAGSGL